MRCFYGIDGWSLGSSQVTEQTGNLIESFSTTRPKYRMKRRGQAILKAGICRIFLIVLIGVEMNSLNAKLREVRQKCIQLMGWISSIRHCTLNCNLAIQLCCRRGLIDYIC